MAPKHREIPFDSTSELINVKDADRYLKVGDFPLQRPINGDHVKELIGEMQAGRFMATGSIGLALIKGKYFLINGRHTLTALIECKRPIRLNVVRYKCQSMDEVGHLYSCFDIGQRRTPYARLKALGITDEFGVSMLETNGVNSAVRLLLGDFRIRQDTAHGIRIMRDADLWARTWRDYKKEISSYLELVRMVEHDHKFKTSMLRSGTVAVAIATLHGGADALHFWKTVINPTDTKKSDPARRLGKWLRDHRNHWAGRDRILKNAAAGAHCWNAYWTGEYVSRVNENVRPIQIYGTQWEENLAKAA